jgi:hypothetical protein
MARLARAIAWIGVLAIIILSVVPAADRPGTALGQWSEHFAAFAISVVLSPSGIVFH